jgi:uncharacterized protein (TIGR03437 family)
MIMGIKKRCRNLSAALVLVVASVATAGAQNFDNSGNGTLTGTYFMRQVLTANLDPNTSAIGRAVSIVGNMTFDGMGNYSFSGQIVDTNVGSSAAPYTVSGTYALAPNGLVQIQNPIDSTDIDYGGVGGIGPNAIVASATEGPYNDILVAIPISSSGSTSSVQGSFQVAFIDFLQGNASQVRDGYYTLTSNGNGSFGNVSVNGSMANQNNSSTVQALSGVTYSLTSGTGTITFPTSGTPLAALVSGPKAFAVSADGNILLGGGANEFDMVVGVKSLTGAASNSMFQGTYYIAALENDASDIANGNNSIDSLWGSTLALGQEDTISHWRWVFFNESAFDYTSDGFTNFATNGTSNDGFYETLLGASGQAVLQTGVNTFYTLTVNFAAKQYSGAAPFIDPVDVWNAASFAPISNSVAPGEYLSIFGTGLSTTTLAASSLPLSTNLGGVQVMVNGVAAPLGYVSPTQINLLIPFETSPDSFATFQVFTNNTPSNQVTVYTNASAPGVFSLTSNGGSFAPGIGPAAITHADGSLVTQSSPAVAGETLVLYVTGLGAVSPAISDGAAGPSNPLSYATDQAIGIDIQDQDGNIYSSMSVPFAGLAPGFAGLYQINFVVPSGVPSGLQWVNVGTSVAYTSEAKIYMQ